MTEPGGDAPSFPVEEAHDSVSSQEGISPAPSVQVEITHASSLYYALAHNGVKFVSSLMIQPGHGIGLTDVEISVTVEDFSGVLTEAWTRRIDEIPRSGIRFDDVDVKLDPKALIWVEEQRPAQVVVAVRSGSSDAHVHRSPVRILAYNQWVIDPEAPVLGMEALSAFVLPNHPVVAELLTRTRGILADRTGSPSTQGYQSGPDRVNEVMHAIYDATQSLGLAYSDPPASWDMPGQKVRTPDVILEDGVATCLDSTLLMAACAEAAGLHPILWLCSGHIVLAWWRTPDGALQSGVVLGLETVANALDLDLIAVVETTTVTASQRGVPFAEAQSLARQSLLLDRSVATLGFVDVRVCRRYGGVLPLPARRTRPDGSVEVIVYEAAGTSDPGGSDASGEAETLEAFGQLVDDAPPRIQQWKKSLLDLTLRNRLINFKDSRNTVGIVIPDGSLPDVEDALHAGARLALLPGDQIDAVHRERGVRAATGLDQESLRAVLNEGRSLFTTLPSDSGYQARLRGLKYRAKTIIDETGANNLYLTMGSLVWSTDKADLRSPLILVPVRIVGGTRGTAFGLELDESGSSTPNFSLLEKLRIELGLTIPGLAEPDVDGAGIDLAAAFQAVRQSLADKGLPFRVDEDAYLAVLQFGTFRLWKDLQDHWRVFMGNPLVKHLVESPTQSFNDPANSEAATGSANLVELDQVAMGCPVPVDSSQVEAVSRAVLGHTFVLEGPPGTGKSQTITNLLARAIAEGKRVAFVAEKRAALDVVKDRMSAIGLAPFCLDLHDKASRPAEIRAQLLATLNHRAASDREQHRLAASELRASVSSLAGYRDRLHEPGHLGISLYMAEQQVVRLGPGPVLEVEPEALGSLDAERLASIRQSMEEFSPTAEAARLGPGNPWGFVDAEGFETIDRPSLADSVSELARISASLASYPVDGHLVSCVNTAEQLRIVADVASGRFASLPVLDEVHTPDWDTRSGALEQALSHYGASVERLSAHFLPSAMLLPLDELVEAAQSASDSFFIGRKKKVRAVGERLQMSLVPGTLISDMPLPELLKSLVGARDAGADLLQQARQLPGVQVSDSGHPYDPAVRGGLVAQVAELRGTASVVAPRPDDPFNSALRAELDSFPRNDGLGSAFRDAARAWERVLALVGAQDEDVFRWLGARPLLEAWRTAVPVWQADAAAARFLQLQRWCELVLLLHPLRTRELESLRESLLRGDVESGEASQALERGIANAVVQERQLVTGLDTFDAAAHGRVVGRFDRSSSQVRELLQDVIPEDLVTSRPFGSGTTVGEVGALARELTKQRRGLGIRALLHQYSHVILELTPCVLVSPESLARFLAPGSVQFDLVVFDEASQIRVAESVGAMGRAASVVVVGDSKQMPPTRFGDAGLPEDDDDFAPTQGEDEFVLDEESILTECVQARVDRLWLSWHYRSQDESLIAFSNMQYYEGRLASFPAPVRGARDAGVKFERVDGQFHRSGDRKTLRTNPREAEVVVSAIRNRLNDPDLSRWSIGVVTFNVQQRDLILALLEDCGDAAVLEALERDDEHSLFVKNLENVQGDERDVILFSLAFSKNDRGVLPLNFGPLNRAGGERRLNVAITRARRQVVLYSSFDPSDLRAEETSSLGLKHLHAYLDMAANGVEASGDIVARTGVVRDWHRDAVADALRERGLSVRTDVGLSDFRIDLAVAMPEDPDRFVLAVLLDGQDWAGRRTVGDRDGLPSQVLQGLLHWPDVARVWLPSWLQDRTAVLDELHDRALAASRGETRLPEPEVVTSETGSPAELTSSSDSLASDPPSIGTPWTVESTDVPLEPSLGLPAAVATSETPFVAWNCPWLGTRDELDRLYDRQVAGKIATAIRDGVAAEGPVSTERLLKKVAGGFGLERVRQDRVEALYRLVPAEVRRTNDGQFLWPDSINPETWVTFRVAGDGRPLEHIAPREIGNAMVDITRVSMGIESEELLRETMALFGVARLGGGVRSVLETALGESIAEGRLQAVDGRVRLL